MSVCVYACVHVCGCACVCVRVGAFIHKYIYINILKRFHIVWRTCFSDVFQLCWLLVLLLAAGEEEGEKELLAVITQMCRIFLESFNTCSGTWEVC